MRKKISAVIWIMLILTFLCGTTVLAGKTVTITSCKISSTDKTKVIVEATGAPMVADTDGYYYLYALQPYQTSIGSGSLQVAKIKQTGGMTFSFPLNINSTNSVFYRKFVIAVKKAGKNVIVSSPSYITNPERLAKVTKAFPKAASKKGLHIQPDMISDAEDLGIKHAAVNICLDLFISSSKSNCVSYNYQGKTYYFSKVGCNEVDRQTTKLAQSNVIVTGILLLRDQGAGRILVPPSARGKGKSYYGFNTMNKEGTETLEALMHFLGDRYMNSGGKYGRIVNWIVGNEVNNYNDYNYLGNLSFSEYVEAYTRSFRICDMALRSVYSKARVYISLDHLWNLLQPHGKCYTSKAMLDAFAKKLTSEGDINWNLAFHPYPSPLTDPVFWDDKVSHSDTTPQITMKNLDYLTDYVSKNFRSDLRVILSEQGFTSKVQGTTKEKLQAAAYAYAYYLTEFNDKVDSFIMNRHVDHVAETQQGLYLGVWTNTPGHLEYAKKKKAIWDVFKYIDSAGSKDVTEFALSYVPGNSWSSLIPGFTWNRFKNMGEYAKGTVKKSASLSKVKLIPNSVKYKYNGKVSKKGYTTIVSVDSTINPVLYSGAGWKYSTKLNFTTRKRFGCKVAVSGMKEKYAHVRIRFFSGANVYGSSTKIAGGSKKQLFVDLSKWKYRGAVTKIQIWVRPYNKSKWKNGARIEISDMRQGI